MFLKLRVEPLDLKDFVGKVVIVIGQGNAWQRRGDLEKNTKKFLVDSCAMKYAQLVEVTTSAYPKKIEISRKTKNTGYGHSYKGDCNSSYIVLPDQKSLEDYLRALTVVPHLKYPYCMPVQSLLEIETILKKHNLI